MAMTPLTPLGKPLSQNPLPGNGVPVSGPHASVFAGFQQTGFQQPYPSGSSEPTAFQWVSLARATWTWLIRPLWYFCVVWPMKVMRYMLVQAPESEGDRRRREEDEWVAIRQCQAEEARRRRN